LADRLWHPPYECPGYAVRRTYASKQNAERAVRAEWCRLQRGLATFSITLARGCPDPFPELPAIVQGFKAQIDSTEWLIVKATHNISGSGAFATELEQELKMAKEA
jgi:uncharacterized protein